MPSYDYNWPLLIPAFPKLLAGLGTTLWISAIAFAFALALALPIALARLSHNRWLNAAGYTYVQVFRSLSTYVLILFFYFGISAAFKLQVQPLVAGIVVLMLLQSAYIAEIYRGALAAVSSGQSEAGASLGMGAFSVLRDITLPQAIRIGIPMLVTQACQIIKDSSVVAVIGGADLMRATIQAVDMTSHPFEFYTAAALLYVFVITLLGGAARLLERTLNRHVVR